MSLQSKVSRREPAISVCVLFDPKNGSIAHIHRTFVFEGGRTRSESEMAARARELLSKFGRDGTHLQVLHVPAQKLLSSKAYKIDLATLAPKEIDISPRARRRA